MAVEALKVEKLTYSYPDGSFALRDISFSIAHGERVALLGPNGAGKSTLLWCLVGILKGSGRVCVDGVVLEKTTERWVRSKLGLAFAEPEDQLFMPTVWRDVTFGPLVAGDVPEVAERKARQAIAQVGLNDRMLDKSAHELSSGERRRAALASILVLQPSVLALDEPTNSLDAPGRAALASTLLQLPCAQLIATHDLSFARCLCTRALVLVDGALVSDISMHELLGDKEALQRFGLEAEVITEDGQKVFL
ncbi:MAG: ABC transporter ATP-binding protein [Armatimonadota bacterium]|nr:ABC transporter ATP-binding protein [Armatimonadota bacterium]